MSELNITIVSPDRKQLDAVNSALPAGIRATVVEGTVADLGNFTGAMVPDILIVGSACEGRSDLEVLERLGHGFPNMNFIMLCSQQSPEFLIHAMRVGVREVLPSPVSRDGLQAAIERIRYKMGMAQGRKGKILAFISCKGGSGATLLASNLAFALAERGRKVALMDLNLQFGDALLFLSDIKPATTLADLARNIDRLDPALLASSMVAITDNLSVLAAPEDPAHGMEVKPDHIDAILAMARSHYDFVLLDVGRTLDAHTIRALDQADKIYPVLQTTMPYIRDGRRLLEVFRTLGYTRDKINLVVNRYQKGGEIAVGDMEQSLGHRIARTIPNHYEAAAAAVNQGVPIARLARSSPVSKALAEWSEMLAPKEEEVSMKWMSRIFGRA
ncbi:AAA family ATPase [Lacisediminimonas profundi]|uniref:AAA family ATPase n=1 Tax=Lacisediminimonas profundi TaxID=2603856 RepID=UPI00124B7326|nr:AAA family ATPase [Lacisediminimonas profundi]